MGIPEDTEKATRAEESITTGSPQLTGNSLDQPLLGPPVPVNNLKIVVPAILLAQFLAALDQTIVAPALPTMVRDLGGGSGYSWVGTAYVLMSACLSPLYGKVSDVFGRKPVYFFAMFLFLLASALCGSAKNFAWLAISRGIQGAAGGGLIQLSQIAISDITPLEKRGTFLGFMGAIWGIASVIGPLVGGSLTDHASWRWCFWLNLPIGGVTAVLLLLFYKPTPIKRASIRDIARTFDFPGLFLITSGVACLLVGFHSGQSSWSATQTIVLIVVGLLLLIGGATNEVYTTRSPVIPPRLFTTRSTTGILVSTFIHAIAFFASNYYLPVYFQILGDSATIAGIRTMPFSLISSVWAAAIGPLVSWLNGYRAVMWASWFVMFLGYGLSIMLDDTTPSALREIYILIAGIGVGGLYQVPLLALHASMPVENMATSTACFNLLRNLGGTIGISIGGAIFESQAQKRLVRIPGYAPSTGFRVTNDIRGLSQIQPLELRAQVLHAYTRSISLIWLVMTPMVFVGLIAVVLIRAYPLKRTTPSSTPEDLRQPSVDEKRISSTDIP